jgi:glycosyltransferase involved in cell wall biosynthesis
MPYLRDCMESLLAQSYSNFEILLVVDSSSDGSLEYIESLADPRVRVVQGRKAGLISALNLLLSETRTTWLVRQDADDIAYSKRLETIARYTQEFPEAGIIFSRAEYYPPDRSFGLFRDSRGTPEELRAVVKSGYLLAFCHPTAVLNVAKTLRIGGYDRTLNHAEDADLWWRAALEFDLQIIPEVLLGYRMHANSLMTQGLHEDAISGLYVQYRLISRLTGRNPLPLEHVKDALDSLIDSRGLQAKAHLRAFNMKMGQRDWLGGALAFLTAIATSPRFVARRFFDEFQSNSVLRNGIDPTRFQHAKLTLWPE